MTHLASTGGALHTPRRTLVALASRAALQAGISDARISCGPAATLRVAGASFRRSVDRALRGVAILGGDARDFDSDFNVDLDTVPKGSRRFAGESGAESISPAGKGEPDRRRHVWLCAPRGDRPAAAFRVAARGRVRRKRPTPSGTAAALRGASSVWRAHPRIPLRRDDRARARSLRLPPRGAARGCFAESRLRRKLGGCCPACRGHRALLFDSLRRRGFRAGRGGDSAALKWWRPDRGLRSALGRVRSNSRVK